MTRTVRVELPDDVAELVRSRVASGAYGSAEEVLAEGVRALAREDAGLDAWLRAEVEAGHAEHLADPGGAVPAEVLLSRILGRAPGG